MEVVFLFILTIFVFASIYFGWRAYTLAGLLAEQQQYVEELEFVYTMLLNNIKNTYDEMKRIDNKRAFESDDEVGTTFALLKQVIDDLYQEGYGTQENEE